MKLTKPQDLIDVFDRILIYVYGLRFSRDNPHKSDSATAQLWTSLGCDIVIASIVLFDRMNAMHERHLRIVDKEDRSNIPGTMKVFTENIEAALRRQSGEEVDSADKAYSQWRSRVKGWKSNVDLWRLEHWGPPPFADGCRVPKSVLAEFQ
jgi:hypothetical protein